MTRRMAQEAGRQVRAQATAVAVRTIARHPVVLAVAAGILAVVAAMAVLLAGTILAYASPEVDAASLQRAIPGMSEVAAEAYISASERASELVEGCAVSPGVLAGIGQVESHHGTLGGASIDASGVASPPIFGPRLDGSIPGTLVVRDSDGGAMDGDPVYDRAVGPMQFLPSSWVIFGDGDPHNIFDATEAAVVHLCLARPVDLMADREQLRAALLGYNRSSVYVDTVLELAEEYDRMFAGPSAGAPSASVDDLLAHPNFSASANAVLDLVEGRTDPRIVQLLAATADRWPIYVGVIMTGHYQCVGGGSMRSRPDCRESHHWYGRAADIISIGGSPMSRSNPHGRDFVEWLAAMHPDAQLRPDEVGSPWSHLSPLPGFFSDANHQRHIHLGVCGPRYVGGQWVEPGC